VSYFVDWKPDAIDGLSAAWVAIADKASVNDAELEITRLLARDPLAVGLHASEGLRQTVDVQSRNVEVLQVAYFVRPSP